MVQWLLKLTKKIIKDARLCINISFRKYAVFHNLHGETLKVRCLTLFLNAVDIRYLELLEDLEKNSKMRKFEMLFFRFEKKLGVIFSA